MRADYESIVWCAMCHPKIRAWKFVLLNLCHHANAEGDAWPSVATVMRETGYSKKAVIDALCGLERCGVISRTGTCGDRNRVTVWSLLGLSGAVHKLADLRTNGVVSTPLGGGNGVVSSLNGKLSTPENGANGVVSSSNGKVSTPGSILGNKESVSKLVSAGVNGKVSTPFVHKVRNGERTVAASPRNEGTPAASVLTNGAALVRTVGWRPKSDLERRAVCQLCYDQGASGEQAKGFVRYNAIRRWTCCEHGTVLDAAKEWVARWRKDEPEAFRLEVERRKAERSETR